jgi:DNA polymerase-3 subunit delta
MPVKTYDEIARDLRNKIYHPVYLLQGDEPYFIDRLCEQLEHSVLDEMHRDFDQVVLYGRDCELLSLISTAKRFPMMANYQVVIVKEAQEMRSLFSRSKASIENEAGDEGDGKENSGPFLNYLLNPAPSTILVISAKYKTLDKRGKIYKTIEKNGVVFESKKMYDDKLPKWIENYLAEKKALIRPDAAVLMAEHLGNDLSRISNECDKLLINLKPGETIDSGHIERNIGISKEFNALELLKAIGQRDILRSTRIVEYFRQNPKNNPIQMTMGMLYNYFSKLLLFHSLPDKSKNTVAAALKVPPFFVDEYFTAARNYPPAKLVSIVGMLREYDLKSKGLGTTITDSGELTRELVYRILH